MRKQLLKPFSSISSIFSTQGKVLSRNLSLLALSLLQSQTANTYSIARGLSSITGKSFNSSEKRVNRFLDSDYFQVDDSIFRCHKNFIFSALKEMNLLQENDPVFINVDFTTKKDQFLILSASIPFKNRGIPLFFTMRNYPKTAGKLNQKKMELAFIKALKNLLPKNYRYVIVADRSFCTQRFINLCLNAKFDYIIRAITNLNVLLEEQKTNLKNINESPLDVEDIYISSWQMNTRLITNKKKGKIWRSFTSLTEETEENKSVIEQYIKRFNIDKMFQDQKSSLFNIEQTQIKKYSKFKKLYYIVNLVQAIMMLMGHFIEEKSPELKKKYPVQSEIIFPLLISLESL